MSLQRHGAEVPDVRDPRIDCEVPLGDLRFRALLSEEEWSALALPIRRRFSKRLAEGKTAVYVGEVVETWMSRAGWLLAQAARLIDGPLPTTRAAHVPSIVSVTEDMVTGGQIWTRLYARRKGFPQVIHSSKRFAGPTGLEEHVGFGFAMSLKVTVEDGALVFRSTNYFCRLGRWRLTLPAWASPGDLTVVHREIGAGRFVFTLELHHPRLGLLIRQTAAFEETAPWHRQ
jgi:uncharacterized protein DUF4166